MKDALSSGQQSIFYGMPPVDTKTKRNLFKPGYAMLLLCDKIVIDKLTFDCLCRNPPATYSLVAETFELLNEEGFVELADYKAILDRNRDLINNLFNKLELRFYRTRKIFSIIR